MKNSIIAASHTVFTGQLFTVDEVSVQLSGGKMLQHEIVHRDATVVVIPITDNYDIYLTSEYRYMLGMRNLAACAGFIEKGETPLAAAKRELEEETGIQATQFEKIAEVHAAASVIDATEYIFLAKGLTAGIPHPTEDEDIILQKISLDEAVAKVLSGQITTAPSMIGILLLDTLRKSKKL